MELDYLKVQRQRQELREQTAQWGEIKKQQSDDETRLAEYLCIEKHKRAEAWAKWEAKFDRLGAVQREVLIERAEKEHEWWESQWQARRLLEEKRERARQEAAEEEARKARSHAAWVKKYKRERQEHDEQVQQNSSIAKYTMSGLLGKLQVLFRQSAVGQVWRNSELVAQTGCNPDDIHECVQLMINRHLF